MKVTASYLGSEYDNKYLIKKYDLCKNIDTIHADLMDGTYTPYTNFDRKSLIEWFSDIKKPVDVHLMVNEPEKYLDTLLHFNSNIIFFHPSVSKDPQEFIKNIKSHKKKAGIAIAFNERIEDYNDYFPLIDAVVLLSIVPGKGGQKFIREALVNYEFLKEKREEYHFELYVDGGINDETISYVSDADGVISGSFIFNGNDFEKQVNILKIGQE